MDFHLTNEQQMLRKMYREFAENEVKPLAEEIDEEERFPMETVEKMAKLGMMRAYGGQAIAVYQASNRAGVEDLLAKGRVDYIFQADYRAGSALEATVQDIIRKMAVTDRLWEENARQVRSIGGDVLLGQVGLF